MENRNDLIVGSVTTRASGHAERLAAPMLIEPPPRPVTLVADKGAEHQHSLFGDRRPYHPPSRLSNLYRR